MKTAVILSARKDKDTGIPYPLKPYYENSCLIDRTIEALTALNYDNILLVVGGASSTVSAIRIRDSSSGIESRL